MPFTGAGGRKEAAARSGAQALITFLFFVPQLNLVLLNFLSSFFFAVVVAVIFLLINATCLHLLFPHPFSSFLVPSDSLNPRSNDGSKNVFSNLVYPSHYPSDLSGYVS